MSSKIILIAAVLVLALAGAQARRPLADAGGLGVRLFSLTQFNSTANLTDMLGNEKIGLKNCKGSIIDGIIGTHAVNMSVTPMWGSLVKVYDFKSFDDFVTYQTCSDNQTSRHYTKPWETDKVYSLVNFDYTNPQQYVPLVGSAGSFCHISLSNGTNDTANAAMVNQRGTLFSKFSGMAYRTGAAIDSGAFSQKYSSKKILTVPVFICFQEVQGGPAYYYFKKGHGNSGGLPLANQIKANQKTGSQEIETFPVGVKTV